MNTRPNDTDLKVLNRCRDSVMYGGCKNPLVEWTLSPEWTEPPCKPADLRPVSGEFVARF